MKWEYLIISVHNINPARVEVIDKAGEDGWELVSVSSGFAYFKRSNLKMNLKMKEPDAMDWLQKAEGLRARGYGLNIYSLEGSDCDKWMVQTNDGRRRYGSSMENVVNQIYDEIKAAKQND